MTRRTAALVFVIGVLAPPSLASAAPTPHERAVAESIFRDAKELAAAGKVAEACPKFVESQRLDPKVGTQIYVATCHEQEGKTATAWIEFTEAIAAAQQSRQPDREKLAKDHAAALEQKLSRLTITVGAATPGLVVKLDGKPMSEALFGTAMPMDPGEHEIEATAPTRKPSSQKVKIGDVAASTIIAIPALESDAPPPPPPPEHAQPAAPLPPSDDGSTKRVVGFAVGGVGLVALGLGTYFGLRAAGQKSDAEKECTGKVCSPSGLQQYDEARTTGTLSTIGFVVGALGLGAGGYLLWTARSSTASSARLVPSISTQVAGLRMDGTW